MLATLAAERIRATGQRDGWTAKRLRANSRSQAKASNLQAYGCGPTLAACSAGTEVAAGATLEALAEIREARIEEAVGGLPAERRHAAAVVARALQAAARDAMTRRNVH